MPDFRFRLNGVIMPEIRIQRAMLHGEPVGDLQIAVRDETVGWFVVDDNSDLSDSLSQFVLEFRDETAWALLPALERRISKDKGWYRTTPQALIKKLIATGAICG